MPRKNAEIIPEGYHALLSVLKERVRAAQIRAALSVNQELILLYWHIGHDIRVQQEALGWGTQIADRFAADLRHAFPGMKGFSRRNVLYMRAFAEAYPDEHVVQQVVARIPWGHTVRLLDAVKDADERLWYVHQISAHGWSRATLAHHIDVDLYHRQGQAPTNFAQTLSAPRSDLAQQILKDPYNFDVRRSTA